MTLIEVMVGFSVMTVMGMALTGVFIQGRSVSVGNIYETTALTVAQGYLEQIKTMDYSVVQACGANPSTNPIPTKGVDADSSGSVNVVDEPLTVGSRNSVGKIDNGTHLGILIDLSKAEGSSTYTPRYMKMWVTPTITDLQPSTGLQGLEIALTFEWESRRANMAVVSRTETVRFVKSNIPSYQ